MAGGNYRNQLFQDYEKLTINYEKVMTELKKQNEQHKLDLTLIENLTKIKEIQKQKIDNLANQLEDQTNQLEAAKKEIARLNQINGIDSHNSGMPTAQTPIQKKKRIPNSRIKTGKKKGGQPGHKKHKLRKFKKEEINACQEHQLLACPHCQGAIEKINDGKSKDEFDYEVLIVKKRHQFPVYQCTDCHKKSRPSIPKHLKEENQYGSHVQGMALSFMNEGNVSINKTKQMIEGFTFGEIVPSEGYLAKLQSRVAKIVTSFSEEIRRHLLTQSLIHWDDTVIMVNEKRACLRYYGDEQLALFKAHQKKNKQGVIDDQLLTLLNEKTVVMHDHLKMNYGDDFSYRDIECNAHLLRDLRRCTDSTQHSWAKKLAELISVTNTRRKKLLANGVEKFTPQENNAFFIQLNDCLILGDEENKKDQHIYYAHKERTLIKRILTYKDQYFSWVTNFDFPFTNNVSERSLRGVKSKMKVAGQFQQITSAKHYATIRTYTETCKRHGINIVDALQRAIKGEPYTLQEVLDHQIDR